jgi:hypothetical protein
VQWVKECIFQSQLHTFGRWKQKESLKKEEGKLLKYITTMRIKPKYKSKEKIT